MKTSAGEAEKLRRELGARRSRRGPLPRELRARGKAFARARAAAGATPATIAVELGISKNTVERWLRTAASAGLLPVRVVDVDHGSAESRLSAVVMTPSGLRIEGLELDAICTLVTRCG